MPKLVGVYLFTREIEEGISSAKVQLMINRFQDIPKMGDTIYSLLFYFRGLSRPNIVLHKISNVMEDFKNEFVKRSQKDYSLSFKLSVVDEVQSGSLSPDQARQKYGIQGSDTVHRWLQKYGILKPIKYPKNDIIH